MERKPLYTTDKGQVKRPLRRRIGQTPKWLKEEIKSLTPQEIASAKIAVGMMLISLGN